MDYDSWKLQTPEEYNGYTELNCVQCGDLFDAPGWNTKFCSYCMEENQEAQEEDVV